MIYINLADSPAYIAKNSNGSTRKAAKYLFILFMFLLISFVAIFLVKTMFIDKFPKDNKVAISESVIEEIPIIEEFPIIDYENEKAVKFEQIESKTEENANSLDNLLKSVSNEISFDTIIVVDDKNFIAQGSSKNRDAVSNFLATLKANNWELLPKPKTSIHEDGGVYNFRIEAFGKNL